jgi:hypothetical protein
MAIIDGELLELINDANHGKIKAGELKVIDVKVVDSKAAFFETGVTVTRIDNSDIKGAVQLRYSRNRLNWILKIKNPVITLPLSSLTNSKALAEALAAKYAVNIPVEHIDYRVIQTSPEGIIANIKITEDDLLWLGDIDVKVDFYFPDAPTDGKSYIRIKDGWVETSSRAEVDAKVASYVRD